MPRYDVCIVGCGLVGLAVGRAMTESHPGISMVLLDKEERVAAHQSSHNSGVIHSGLYYRPGSLKAELAFTGAKEMYRLCEETGVGHRRSGKIVVATHPAELPALDELERRGVANGLAGLRRLGRAGIAEIEPAATGIDALHVPEAGVADFSAVASVIAGQLREGGSELLLGHRLTRVNHTTDGAEVVAGEIALKARLMVNCAGLHSDRVAVMAGLRPGIRIIPFRGEYYTLAEEKASLVKTLIYPVPDPRFPFLGVHFTRRFDGTVEVGPNALLALAREQYRGSGADLGDLGDIIGWPGFWRLARRHLGSGARELINSKWRGRYASLARRLVPAVEAADLRPGGVGVRAQAVDRGGRLLDDFVIETAGNTVHVLNAPSPGATASLAIGRHVSRLLAPLL
ncbi:MAG: L-2-hydroxyglutarate oxidase [Actinobacteria bacterium]|nr:L-2-hydroxyglutarate oxidase [Actinomycetota bacterium]